MPLSLRFDTAPPADHSRVRIGLGRVLAAGGGSAGLVVAERDGVRVLRPDSLVGKWTPGFTGPAHAVALSADGARLALATHGVIQIWSVDGLIEERAIPAGATCLAFDDQGQLVAGSGSAATWVQLGSEWGSFATHERGVLCVDRSGSVVLSGGADAQVTWTDLDAGKASLFQGHVGSIKAVRLVPGGRALSASLDGTVRLWSGPDGRCVWTARPPVGAPGALAVEGDTVLVGGETGAMALLDVEKGRLEGVLLGHRRPIVAVGLHTGGGAWSVAQDRSVRTWHREDAIRLPPLLGHRGGVRACLLASDAAWTGGRDGTLRAWNLARGAEMQRLGLGSSALQAIQQLDAGDFVVGCGDGRIVRLDSGGRIRWARTPAHDGPVTCLGLLPDGPMLSGGADGVLRAWEPGDGAPLWAGAWHTDRLRCLSVGPDGQVATGGYDGLVRVGEPFAGGGSQLCRHDAVVVGLAWCGRCVVSGALDGSLQTTGPAGAASQTMAHPDGVVGVRALDEERVASIGRDGLVRTWHARDLSALDTMDLGVPLDGIGGSKDTLLIGDRRGGVHLVDVLP